MKFRTGFVSNSSAASFIVKFTTSLKKSEVAKAIKVCHQWIADNWDNGAPTTFSFPNKQGKQIIFKNPPPLLRRKLKKVGDHYEWYADTSMFNDWRDVSEWPFIRMISEDKYPGIKLIEIEQTEDGNDGDIPRIATYDPRTFETEWYEEEHFKKTERAEKKKEAEKSQKKVEIEYLIYLSNLGVIELTDDQIVLVAKHHLKNEKD
jgi:hypothetical protein